MASPQPAGGSGSAGKVALPDATHPGMRIAEVEVAGARPLGGRYAVGTWVGPEEPHVGALAPDRRQRLGDPGLRNMPLGVDGEVVPAEADTGRPRLDPGQVDAPHRELGE